MRAKKGMRTMVIDDVTYYWKVSEEVDWYSKELRVFDEHGHSMFTRCYSLEDNIRKDYFCIPNKGRNSEITPAVVRSAILEEKEFDEKRAILDQIQYKESSQHWQRVKEIYFPELIAGIGLDVKDDILVCISQLKIDEYRRTIIDLKSLAVLYEDFVIQVPKSKENSTYLSFGPLKHEIPYFECANDFRTAENQHGEKICCYTFHPKFIYFQPNNEDCIQSEQNKGCVKLSNVNVYNKYGFSASGDCFVVAEQNTLIIWKRDRT